MPGQRTAVLAAFALAVVLAGCGAPVAGPSTPAADAGTPTPTASPSTPAGETPTPAETDESADQSQRRITVANGSLAVDPDVVFERVQRLQGTDVDRPQVVEVYNSIEAFANESGDVVAGPNRAFYELAGMGAQEVNVTAAVTRQKNGYVTGFGSIVLYVGENASRADELLLVAHELTHYVQLQSGRQAELSRNIGDISLTDNRYVRRSVVEGGAVVTTDAYLGTYADTNVTNTELYTGLQSALPDGHIAKYENGKYVNGRRYVASRTESPSGLAAVYERPPQTSEQVLHRLPPGTEPPTPLSVSVETGPAWVAAGYDRMGEAFVRTALERAVGEQRAVTAAAGWGNDTVRFLRPADGEGDTAYVWVLRWDDAADRTEFQSAYERSLARRGTETASGWRLGDENVSASLSAPTDRTSVLVFGPDSLVADVTVTGEAGRVTVWTP